MYYCPECLTENVERSRSKNAFERWFLRPLLFRHYRCQSCYARFLIFDYETALIPGRQRKLAIAVSFALGLVVVVWVLAALLIRLF